MSDAAIVQHEGVSSTALASIVGTGDVRRALATLEQNVRDVIDVARERGFVSKFGSSDREFYGLPAWQLLASVYGLMPFVEWSKKVEHGWEARAVVKTMDGAAIGAAEAMCTREEPTKRRSSEHDLRAMAQTRAMRNALRAVLGSALVMAGYSFSDPDAPATKDQIKAVWTLAGKHDWHPDEAHERAGVASMKELTREQAAELIDEWSELGEAQESGTAEKGAPGPRDLGVGSPPLRAQAGEGDEVAPAAPAPSPADSSVPEGGRPTGGDATSSGTEPPWSPATPEQWAQATKTGWTSAKLLKRARQLWPEAAIRMAAEISEEQMARILEEVV